MFKIMFFIIGIILSILGFSFFTKSGFYVFLDTIFYPIYELNGFFSQSIYGHTRDILNMILGYKLFSKIYILLVLVIGSFLGIKIGKYVNKFFDIRNGEKISIFNKLLGIIFILFNPFIYERLVTQTGIALGVFLIGFGFIFLLEFLGSKKIKSLYISSLFFGLSLTVFQHAIIFLIIVFLTTLVFFYKSFNLKNIFLSFIVLVSLNFNWIYGYFFMGANNMLEKVEVFNLTNIEAFQSNSIGNLGVELTQLMLYGFWGEKYNHLYTPDKINDKWYITGFLILLIVSFGFVILYKHQKKLSLYILTIATILYILSLGLSSNLFDGFNNIIYRNIPYYIGMREPEKLLGLVSIIYSIFFIIGVNFLAQLIKSKNIKRYFPHYIQNIYFGFILIIFFIISWSPNVLFGFNGQLKIINYPSEYFITRDILLKNYSNQKILVLPWHSYIACKWTNGKVISNPLPFIFKPLNIVQADNIEIGQLYTNSKSEESKKIELFLKNKELNLLNDININYIVLQTDCADFYNYSYLKNYKDLEQIFYGDSLEIYKIK